MTPSYLVRLALLASASLFVIQSLLGALVAILAPAAIRQAENVLPSRAARLLLTLRLLPAGLSALAVIALCIPSYLRFEPQVTCEEVGAICFCAASLGAILCGIAIYRTVAALVRSSRYLRRSAGVESRIDRETVWVVPASGGLALAGILRPRMLVSARAIEELSSDQLAVALRHEHAHETSRDNLKRLLMLLAPPMYPGMRVLERAWAKYAEWAADDRAVRGDAEQSVALAAALIRVARLQTSVEMPPLIASLVEADKDLSARVDRLLHRIPVRESKFPFEGLSLGAVAAVAAIAMNPATLRMVHRLLERLLD